MRLEMSLELIIYGFLEEISLKENQKLLLKRKV